jgi:hypothetical protein
MWSYYCYYQKVKNNTLQAKDFPLNHHENVWNKLVALAIVKFHLSESQAIVSLQCFNSTILLRL